MILYNERFLVFILNGSDIVPIIDLSIDHQL
jgi:hypothetical protein